MADSIREQILQAVETRLATITTANGYETNIGNSVERSLRAPLEEHELPAVIFNEGTETGSDDLSMGYQYLYLPVTLSARKTFDSDDVWQKVGGKMLADMIKAIGTDTQFSNLALDTSIKENNVGTDKEKANVVGVDLTILIRYRIAYLDPYNQ